MNNTNEPTASHTNNPAASSDRPTTLLIGEPIHLFTLVNRESTPSKSGRQPSEVYQVVKRLRESHHECSNAAHICTIEGCKQLLLKLQKRTCTDVWHSSKATEHVKKITMAMTTQGLQA